MSTGRILPPTSSINSTPFVSGGIDMGDTFAQVSWNAEDLSDWVRDDGTVDGDYLTPEKFYAKHESSIQEAMIAAGWSAIERILGPRREGG
jgi:hypothetical protein